MAPVYAVAADLEALIEGFTITNAPAADRLLERAERWIDDALGPMSTDPATGLKLGALGLSAEDTTYLRRATVFQAEYELEMGYDFFVRSPVATNAHGVESHPPKLAPKAAMELQKSGLMRLTANVGGPRRSRPPWDSFVRNTDY